MPSLLGALFLAASAAVRTVPSVRQMAGGPIQLDDEPNPLAEAHLRRPAPASSSSAVGSHILRRTLPAELQRLHGAHRQPLLAAAGRRAPLAGSECPASLAAQIAAAGHLSVAWTGATGANESVPGCNPALDGDDALGVQAAIDLSPKCGGPPVFFPGAVRYCFRTTVNITGKSVRIIGGTGRDGVGVNSAQGLMSGAPTFISGTGIPAGRPVFFFNSSGSAMELSNFAIEAGTTGIKIENCAGVRIFQVGISVSADPTSVVEPGCGVSLGSDNAALVIVNSFWIWVELSSFLIGPYPNAPSATCPDPKNHSTCCQGQKPSVILRGGPTAPGGFPPSVYLLHWKDISFWGGGVQYQQTFCAKGNYQHVACDDPKTAKPNLALAGDLAPGWFSFVNTVLEYSATPLLDVQSDPTLSYNFEGLYAVTVSDFQHQDSTQYRCLDSPEENAQPLATVAHLNCSQSNCGINGLTISGAGFQSGPAVRIIRGRGTLATFIADPSHGPEGADGVVDGLGRCGSPEGSSSFTDFPCDSLPFVAVQQP
jgi:hypothetical protein